MIKKDEILSFINRIKVNTIKIVLTIVFYLAVALFGTAFTDTTSEWYSSLLLPAIQPPPQVFMYVWSFLYLLLTVITAFIVTNEGFTPRLRNLLLANGVLNVLWSYVFFTKENLFGALLVLIALIIIGYFIYKELNRIKPLFGYLFVPYLAWLVLAIYLNYMIYFLN